MNEQFEKAIKSHLDERAATDPQFAASYAKPHKSIKECCKFIIGWVKADGGQGYPDEVIFGQAVHYYDEDDIKVGKQKQSCKVISNQGSSLTPTDIAKVKAEAVKEYQDKMVAKPKRKAKSKEDQTLSLF